MILRFLRLFPQFRKLADADVELECLRDDVLRLGKENYEALDRLRKIESQLAHAEDARKAAETILKRSDAERDALRSENSSLKDDIRLLHENCLKIAQDKAEVIANAGDALALRTLGRRMFSKAPVEAPPPEAVPANISTGSGKRFARDVQREKNLEFFQKALKNVQGTQPKAN